MFGLMGSRFAVQRTALKQTKMTGFFNQMSRMNFMSKNTNVSVYMKALT